jgi:tRNA (mo5U34)-methyltransferase
MQFNIVNYFSTYLPIFVLPIGVDELPNNLKKFDTVFSMGLLYHRREPIEHIKKIFSTLVDGGEIVLETLIIDKCNEELFIPKNRYAKMRNVWNIPTVSLTKKWLRECGFKNVKCIDVSKTTFEEQRKTEWMQYESLKDFLSPTDQNLTIEGEPAPVRAIFTGEK